MRIKNILLIILTLSILFFVFLIIQKQNSHIHYLKDYNNLLTNQFITTINQIVDINENVEGNPDFLNNLIYNQDTVFLFESYLKEEVYYLTVWIEDNTCSQCLDELRDSNEISLKKEKIILIGQNINPRNGNLLATKYNDFTFFQIDCPSPIWPYSDFNSQPILALFRGSNLICSYVPFKSNPSLNQKVYKYFISKVN